MRVPEITSREDLPEDQREFYDSIIASRKRISAPYNFLLLLATRRRGLRT